MEKILIFQCIYEGGFKSYGNFEDAKYQRVLLSSFVFVSNVLKEDAREYSKIHKRPYNLTFNEYY